MSLALCVTANASVVLGIELEQHLDDDRSRGMDAKRRGDWEVALFGIVYTFISARAQTESGDPGYEHVGQM
jgi:hypothetical protein